MAQVRLFPYFSAAASLLAFLACQEAGPVDPDGVPSNENESSDITQEACAHDVCVTGVKLTTTCDPCAATVCAADSFCCTSSWDSICVSEAKSMCSRCGTGGSGGTGGSSTGGTGGTGGTGTGGTGGGAENTNALCSDGKDNDGDGFVDCNDFDCSKNPLVTVCGSTGGTGGTGGSGGSGTGGTGTGGTGTGGTGTGGTGTGGTGTGGTGTGGTGTGGSGGSGGSTLRVRIMASNQTGDSQKYGPEASRIFQALDPDVVVIQEFNTGDNSQAATRAYVDEAFGTTYSFFRESGNGIPNGIISRYPILQSGEWDDTSLTDRDYAFAKIGLPNGRNLWAVSVHLRTTSSSARLTEATQIVNNIKAQVPAADLLVIGGDFNTSSRTESCISKFGEVFVTGAPYPADQSGNTNTNNSRGKPYDWLLADPDLDPFETSVQAGASTFPAGLVFDSRVFSPISSVAPVLKNDSSSFQHMGVVREFLIPPAN